jgi:peptidoglycan/xylan/chitin deacetylase (PgdA/CDA1 family)
LCGKISLPENSIAFTIDDGFYDQGSLAAPIFIEFNCPLTIFLISGFLDGDLWPWYSKVEFLIENTNVDTLLFTIPTKKDSLSISLKGEHNKSHARRSILKLMKSMNGDLIPETIEYLERATQIKLPDQPPDNFKPITWEMARELENAGVVFGPHTVSHPILSNVNDQQSQDEIIRSWYRLNQELKNPSPVFCYPNGEPNDFGDREIKTLKKNGFLGAVSTTPGQVIKNSRDSQYLFRLPRYSLPYEFSDFIMYCSWIEFAKETIRGN